MAPLLKDSQQLSRKERTGVPSDKKICMNSATAPGSPKEKGHPQRAAAETRRVIKTTYNLKAGQKRRSSGTEYDEDRQRATDTLQMGPYNNEDLGLLQPLVNAYNGIDSRLPKVPYTGILSSKQEKES